jgi:hypothetical protein
MPRYTIELTRTIERGTSIKIDASSQSEAKDKALQLANALSWKQISDVIYAETAR